MPSGAHNGPRDTSGIAPHQWKPGQSGNKRGRPRGGPSMLEQLNILTAETKPGTGKHTVAKLTEIADAPPTSKISYAKRAAAVQLLEALRPGRYGTIAYHRLMDRLLGYPRQSLDLDAKLDDVKRIVIVEDFTGRTLLNKAGNNIIQARDGSDVLQVDGKYLDGGVPVPQITDTNVLPPP